MSNLRIYVAAPFEDSDVVKAVHHDLRKIAVEPSARWVDEVPDGKEDFSKLSPMQHRANGFKNDEDIMSSHALLVMARAGTGGEMFAEARFALTLGVPVLWVGRVINSSYRETVFRSRDLNSAMAGILTFVSDPAIRELLDGPTTVPLPSDARAREASRVRWAVIKRICEIIAINNAVIEQGYSEIR